MILFLILMWVVYNFLFTGNDTNVSICFGRYWLSRLRQYRQYKLTKPPAELSSTIKEEDFKKSQRYGADKLVFGALKSFFDLGQTFAFFQYDLLSWAWIASGWVMSKYLGYGAEYEVCYDNLVLSVVTRFLQLTENIKFFRSHILSSLRLYSRYSQR